MNQTRRAKQSGPLSNLGFVRYHHLNSTSDIAIHLHFDLAACRTFCLISWASSLISSSSSILAQFCPSRQPQTSRTALSQWDPSETVLCFVNRVPRRHRSYCPLCFVQPPRALMKSACFVVYGPFASAHPYSSSSLDFSLKALFQGSLSWWELRRPRRYWCP